MAVKWLLISNVNYNGNLCIFFDIDEYYYSEERLSQLNAANFNSIVDKYCTSLLLCGEVNVPINREESERERNERDRMIEEKRYGKFMTKNGKWKIVKKIPNEILSLSLFSAISLHSTPLHI